VNVADACVGAAAHTTPPPGSGINWQPLIAVAFAWGAAVAALAAWLFYFKHQVPALLAVTSARASCRAWRAGFSPRGLADEAPLPA